MSRCPGAAGRALSTRLLMCRRRTEENAAVWRNPVPTRTPLWVQAISATGQACGSGTVCPSGTVCTSGICKVSRILLCCTIMLPPRRTQCVHGGIAAAAQRRAVLRLHLQKPCDVGGACGAACVCPSATPTCDAGKCKVRAERKCDGGSLVSAEMAALVFSAEGTDISQQEDSLHAPTNLFSFPDIALGYLRPARALQQRLHLPRHHQQVRRRRVQGGWRVLAVASISITPDPRQCSKMRRACAHDGKQP